MNTPVAELLFASLFSSQNTKKTTTTKQPTNQPTRQTNKTSGVFFVLFCFLFFCLVSLLWTNILLALSVSVHWKWNNVVSKLPISLQVWTKLVRKCSVTHRCLSFWTQSVKQQIFHLFELLWIKISLGMFSFIGFNVSLNFILVG